VNPCTGEVITKTRANQLCYPSTASDVPGPAVPLCWYPYIQTWYPKQRLTMNTTTDKWPINAKDIGVAVKPPPPLLALLVTTSNSVELSWTLTTCEIFPITSFNIYVNNVLRENILNIDSFTTILTNINKDDQIFMTSVSTTYESPPSNIVSSTNPSALPYVSNNKLIHIDKSSNNTNNSNNNTNSNNTNSNNTNSNNSNSDLDDDDTENDDDDIEYNFEDDIKDDIEENIEGIEENIEYNFEDNIEGIEVNNEEYINESETIQNKNYKLPDTNKNTVNKNNKRVRINPIPNTLRHINSLMNDHTIARINNYVINYNKLMNDPNATFTMDTETFNELNVGLSTLTKKNNYTKIHIEKNLRTYKNILRSMHQAFAKKKQYNDLTTASANWKKDSEILRNTDLLKSYLESLKISRAMGSLTEFKAQVPIPLDFNPIYLEYYRLYGIPKDNLFDPELLLEIQNRM
jgi:hypothetical protein